MSVVRVPRLLLVTFALVACAPAPEQLPPAGRQPRCERAGQGDYVRVCQGRFVLDQRVFPIVGVNAYYLQDEAARELARGQGASPTVEEVFGELAAIGATVVRTWAFNDDPRKPSAIQLRPDRRGEPGLRALDHVIAAAERHGLRLILPLVNYWPEYGGVDQYLRWHGRAVGRPGDRGAFFGDPRIRAHYRAHLTRMMRRENVETGRSYAAEPAVLAWELINEARGEGTDKWTLAAWVDEMATTLVEAGARQLIGSGESGYDDIVDRGGPNHSVVTEDVGSWVLDGSQGTSFSFNTRLVDFGSVHCHPEAWNVGRAATERSCSAWIGLHRRLAGAMGRPLLCGEISLVDRERAGRGTHSLAERRAIYRRWLALAERGEVAGLLPWLYVPDGRPAAWDPASFGRTQGSDAADPRNRYVDLLEAHARAMRAASGGTLASSAPTFH